ncbi:ATP-binding cassette, subfamily B [Oceanospirillum multiglobuliferum]|uniref:ABC transporter n=1 Tax=Oceanospirillum multiglobuliferum TaxID=64969 RepID=A0A1T4QWK5_9GAMM|nr:ABC transporter transmembrane domain-containing protein [Oceanospirillum multiglobuliferum]OPX57085.1 hypothetical protein BTE48_01255 [Oceanospirillum multiglobuliferum]SKA08133.1 ATP-binding cassette, subfamily B [Oceanospirillum multiglobuliferum]
MFNFLKTSDTLASFKKVLSSPDLRKLLPIILLSSLLSNLFALALPLGILQIFDRILKNQSQDTLFFVVFGIILILILEEFLKMINGTVTNWLGARFRHKSGMKVLEKYFYMPFRLYAKEEAGAYAEKIQTVGKVADVYSGSALLVLVDLPFVFVFIFAIYLIAGNLVFIPLFIIFLFSLATILFGRWMYSQIEQRDLNDERRISFLTEVLAGILSVKTMSVENIMLRRYERLKETSATQGERLFFGNTLSSNLGSVMSQLMIVLVIFFGSILVVKGDITSGALAACMMLSVRSLQPLRKGLSTWMRYQTFIAGDKRLTEVFKQPGSPDTTLPALNEVTKSIEMANVTLDYGSRGNKPLFKELNFLIPVNSCIAIRGDSGSGKSSLLSLLNGFEYPDTGTVLIDGVPISDYSSESVRKRIALLPQVGAVFAGSILENLTLFNPALEARALELSEELGLDILVAGMTQGYQTPLGEGSNESVPMGVRQLIAIVRALVSDPDVILVDEANSSLDFEGDKKLRLLLEKRKGTATIILVTSRPSLLKLADAVYKIDDYGLKEDVRSSFFGSSNIVSEEIDKPVENTNMNDVIGTRVFNYTDLSACLIPLLNQLGWQANTRAFAEALPHLADHVDVSYFFSTVANLGYKSSYFGSSFRHFDDRLLPCLFLEKGKPAVVIKSKNTNDQYVVFNSQTGLDECWGDLSKRTGDIYVFKGIEPEVLSGKKPWVNELFWKFKSHVFLIFFITLLSTIMAIAPSLFVRSVFDTVLPTGDIKMGGFMLVGVFLAISLGWFLNVLRGKLLAYVGGRIEYVLGSTIFEKIIRLNTSSLNSASVSRQISRIKSLEKLRDLFLGPLVLIVFDLPASVILLVVVFIINPWAGLIVSISIICFLLLLFITRPFSDRVSDESSSKIGKKVELVDETLSSMKSIRLVGASGVWLSRLRVLSGQAAYANFNEQQGQMKISTTANVIGSLTAIIVLAISTLMVIKGQITSGTIMATMILTWRLVAPLQNLFLAMMSWSRISTNINQVNQLMKLGGESESGNSKTNRFISNGAISFSRVSFRYTASSDPVLLGISFNALSKKVLGITGPDGAGKSTLLAMISRIYFPQAGAIKIDTIDTRQISAEYLRSIVSFMPQRCDVFYGTVSQNLRLVHPAATMEELEWAAKMSGLFKDIEQLDRGFETRISNSFADQLSNGFRQRLSLARTMLKPASIVLLDEPGNGMDEEGEQALVRCINWLRGRSTLIIVTPRPSHLKLTDHILYLEAGTITARGSYKEVEEKIMAGLS